MKNKIKYFVLYPLMLLIVILTLTYDVKELIGLGQRIPFGSSYWKDSLNDAISTNKSIKLGTGDSLYYNGVVVTSGTGGGGIAASDNTTFTGINTFTDSLRANGYTLIDDAKITSYLRVTGEVTTDLNFNKGSKTNIGTISTDTLSIITYNTDRIKITSDGKVLVLDSLIMSSYDIFPANGKGLNWSATGDQIFSNSGTLEFRSENHNFNNILGFNLLSLDSASGMTLNYGVFTGSGTGLTSVDAITLKGQDTTHYAHTDTLTTERVKSKTEFSDIVTFFLSPVFSALVTIGNGVTVNGTATFNGDMIPTWVKNNSSVSAYQYEKTKIVGFKLGATTALTTATAHGIADWHTIKSYDVTIQDDSSNTVIHPNTYSNDASAAGKLYTICWIDSLNCSIRIGSLGVNLPNDSAFFTIRYVDFNR